MIWFNDFFWSFWPLSVSEAESSWNYGHLINVLLINPVNVLQEFPATTCWIVKPLVNGHNPSMLWSDYFS